MPISTIAIEEKNKLNGGTPFILLAKLTIPGVSDPFYFVRYFENLTWKGQVYTAFDFYVDEITDSNTGEIPSIAIKFSNVGLYLGLYVHEYDLYIKVNGYEPVIVDLYSINLRVWETDNSCAPEEEYSFELVSPSQDGEWCSFSFGAPNPWNIRFPANRLMRNNCRYRRFKTDPRCGYAGVETECNRTLARCREIWNPTNADNVVLPFGGTPGVAAGGR